MLIPTHIQLEPSNSRTRVPAGGINLIASIDFGSDGATTATLSSSTKVSQGDDAILSAEVATPNHSNQQYSIYAITDAAANIAERYAYTAYGQPTILNAAATVIATSAISNKYTYTAREWDATVGLYHFRARWMSGLTGRFLTRDPIAGSIQRDFGYEKQVSATEIVELMRHAASANGTVISSELVGKVLSRVLHQLPLTNENEPSFHSKLRTYQNIYQFFNGSPAAGVDPEGEMFFCPCNYKVRLWPAIPAPRGVLMPFPTPGFCGWPCCSILPPTCLNFAWFRSNGIGAGVPWAITPIPGFDTCP